jgi:RNA polymerase sigma-70 factor (ECF subfamily)
MTETGRQYKDEDILALSLRKPSVFSVLFDRYQDAFMRTALKIVRQREEAEDIVQETFTKIYLNAGKFKTMEGARFKSWAYKILINTSFTHYKKLKKIRNSTVYADNILYENLEDENMNNLEASTDAKIIVSQILPQVPAHLQGVLQKYYLEDKSQKDIAGEENVSVATVKMRLFRAKRELKKMLGDEQKMLCLM